MINPRSLILFIVLLLPACAVLDRSRFFKSGTGTWTAHKKYPSVSGMNFSYSDWDLLSYTYSSDTSNVVYLEICYLPFSYGFIIPVIPNILPFSSGKKRVFCLSVKSERHFSPTDITCIIDGEKAYPYSIDQWDEQYKSWKSYWTTDSAYIGPGPSPYNIPAGWETLSQNDTTGHFYQYWYNINQVSITNAEIHFPNGLEPLYLKRKKGLQYVFLLFPPAYR